MSKLRLLIENSLDNDGDRQLKTCFKTFCSKVENDGSKFFYQGIKLSKYELTTERAKQSIPGQYRRFVLRLSKDFLHLPSLLRFKVFPCYFTHHRGQEVTPLVLEIVRLMS